MDTTMKKLFPDYHTHGYKVTKGFRKWWRLDNYRCIHIEMYWFRKPRFGASVSIENDGEDSFAFHISTGVFCFYFNYDSCFFHKSLIGRTLLKGKHGMKRLAGVSIHHGRCWVELPKMHISYENGKSFNFKIPFVKDRV